MALLEVDGAPLARDGDDEIRLAAEQRRRLQDIDDGGDCGSYLDSRKLTDEEYDAWRRYRIRRDLVGLMVSSGNLLIGEGLQLDPDRVRPADVQAPAVAEGADLVGHHPHRGVERHQVRLGAPDVVDQLPRGVREALRPTPAQLRGEVGQASGDGLQVADHVLRLAREADHDRQVGVLLDRRRGESEREQDRAERRHQARPTARR